MWQINLAEEHSSWVCSSPPITFPVLPVLTSLPGYFLRCRAPLPATYLDSEVACGHYKFVHTSPGLFQSHKRQSPSQKAR